eukprot:Gb_02730 [translate_table: standard]
MFLLPCLPGPSGGFPELTTYKGLPLHSWHSLHLIACVNICLVVEGDMCISFANAYLSSFMRSMFSRQSLSCLNTSSPIAFVSNIAMEFMADSSIIKTTNDLSRILVLRSISGAYLLNQRLDVAASSALISVMNKVHGDVLIHMVSSIDSNVDVIFLLTSPISTQLLSVEILVEAQQHMVTSGEFSLYSVEAVLCETGKWFKDSDNLDLHSTESAQLLPCQIAETSIGTRGRGLLTGKLKQPKLWSAEHVRH